MLKKEVLVKGISNLSDARYCAGMGVNYISFELNKDHEDFVGFDKIIEIKNWLSGPKIGGRLSDWSEEISWEELNLDFLVLQNAQLLNLAKQQVGEIFLETELPVSSEVLLSEFDHLVVQTEDLEQLGHIKHNSLFITYNIDHENIDSLLSTEALSGIALKGNQESRPGFSQYDELMDVLEALEED